MGDGGLVAYADYQDAMGWYERTDVENPMISVNEVDVASSFCLLTVWILKTIYTKLTKNQKVEGSRTIVRSFLEETAVLYCESLEPMWEGSVHIRSDHYVLGFVLSVVTRSLSQSFRKQRTEKKVICTYDFKVKSDGVFSGVKCECLPPPS